MTHEFFFFFFFFFFFKKQTYTQGRGKGILTQRYTTTLLKSYSNFKGGWDKLYYTQHTLLRNVGQLLILFFFRNKHTHTREREGVP